MQPVLSDDEVDRIVREQIHVNHQAIAMMKGWILKHFSEQPGNTANVIREALKETGAEMPKLVNTRQDDAIQQIQKVGNYISWYLNAVEAVWQLVHAGTLFPNSAIDRIGLDVTLTTMSHGSGTTGNHDFSWVQPVFFPHTVWRSKCDTTGFLLTDPDLYLQDLMPLVPHPEVQESLKEAVRCFRAELYMACIVMLGKGSEGAWIELGKALADILPQSSPSAKLRSELDDPYTSFARKLRAIHNHWESNHKEYKTLRNVSGVTVDDLRIALSWSDTLRDARNVIHYGKQPSFPHDWEHVASVLLTGSKHFRTMYELYNAVRNIPTI